MSPNPNYTTQNAAGCTCYWESPAHTPQEVENRPGLSAIAYRTGIHSQFKEAMLAKLSPTDLTTRDGDDFTIALLDAWAAVADVLTFYQERIANESYLRTARERLSVLQLARLIGYDLSPGVAAGTHLAFKLEEPPQIPQNLTGSSSIQAHSALYPEAVVIGRGTKVQSVPKPGGQPQLFETVEAIEARAEWNELRPRMTQAQTLSTGIERLWLKGTDTKLKPGDVLLIVVKSGGTLDVIHKRVRLVEPDYEKKITGVEFARNIRPEAVARPLLPAGFIFPQQKALTAAAVNALFQGRVWSGEEFEYLLASNKWDAQHVQQYLNARLWDVKASAEDEGVYIFRERIGFFGHNAPYYFSLLTKDNTPLYPNDWDSHGWSVWKDSLAGDYYYPADIYLERSVAGIGQGDWALFETSAGTPVYYRVAATTERSLAGFGMSAKVTGLTLVTKDGGEIKKRSDLMVRTTTAYVRSEKLELADIPIDADIMAGESEFPLDRVVRGLAKGQPVIVSGTRTDLAGVAGCELLFIMDVSQAIGCTTLTFSTGIKYSYKRDTVSLNANVAPATHGETVHEILGSGDTSVPYQQFTLRQPPLTWVSAATPTGTQSTLEIRVNDLLWHEVSTFLGHDPDERIYVTRTDETGKTTVQFGDGQTGARLHTGSDNIRATYRKGIGMGGLVDAGRLSLLMTRQAGVKEVSNLLAATGAADPETLEEARRNAPLKVLTLDRIVSLRDYEDFAQSFAGIARAFATWTWNGEKRCVFVTVAGPMGAEVGSESEPYRNLLKAMQQYGNPHVPLRVESYIPVEFKLAASVQVDPGRVAVLEAVKEALKQHFSFDARSFGQSVALSEVLAVMQAVPGVIGVDVDEFSRIDRKGGDGRIAPLPADMPREGSEAGQVLPAELLTIKPGSIDLKVMQ